MNLHKLIFTNCDSYKSGTKITPKGVMVHSTAVNNPNLCRYVGPDDGLLGANKYNNHWNRPKVGKSVHAFIGKLKDGSVATYQVLPWNYKAGHCAKGKKGSGNNTHIAFEICEDNLKDPVYFTKVYREAVELTAMLCKEYKLDPMADGVVICHSEGYKRGIASNHGDVMHWFPKHGKSMDTFRADVKALLDGEKKSEAKSSDKLTVDGKWGPSTTKRLQKIFGTTVDGEVSNQWAKYKDDNPGLGSCWEWEAKPNGKGSSLIKAMQKWAGMPTNKCDGEWGPNTCKAVQKKLGTQVTGKVGNPSQMVKALQRWANEQ